MSDDKEEPGVEKLRVSLTLPALERLLGGDTQLEFDLRQQVVANFAKKHLKAVAGDPAFASVIESHRKVLDAEVRDLVGELIWDHRTGKTVAKLKDTAREIIMKAAEPLAAEIVEKHLKSYIDSRQKEIDDWAFKYEGRSRLNVEEKTAKLLAELDGKLAKRVDEFFEARVQAEVKRRLDAAAALPA